MHEVSLVQYTAIELRMARQEIEMEGKFQLKQKPHWLMKSEACKVWKYRKFTIVITVRSQTEALKMIANKL